MCVGVCECDGSDGERKRWLRYEISRFRVVRRSAQLLRCSMHSQLAAVEARKSHTLQTAPLRILAFCIGLSLLFLSRNRVIAIDLKLKFVRENVTATRHDHDFGCVDAEPPDRFPTNEGPCLVLFPRG